MRIFFKRFAQEVLPKKVTRRKVVRLEAKEGEPVIAQLRTILANKANARRIVDQLEIWDEANERMVSRKEFRQAFHFCGFSAHKDDMNALFDEIDADSSGEVDFDELHAAIKRIQSGAPPPVSTGNAAAKLAAKENASPATRAARMKEHLAAKDQAMVLRATDAPNDRSKKLGGSPPRVAPAPRAAPGPLALLAPAEPAAPPAEPPAPAVEPAAPPALVRPPSVVTFDPVAMASPAFMRAVEAVSPTLKRGISAVSQDMARAAGVSELFAKAVTPTKTPNTQRLENWSKIAEVQKPQWKADRVTTILREHGARQAMAPGRAMMRPPASMRMGVA